MISSPSSPLPEIVIRSNGAGRVRAKSATLLENVFLYSSNCPIRPLIGPLSTVCELKRPFLFAGSSWPYRSGPMSCLNLRLNAASMNDDPHLLPTHFYISLVFLLTIILHLLVGLLTNSTSRYGLAPLTCEVIFLTCNDTTSTVPPPASQTIKQSLVCEDYRCCQLRFCGVPRMLARISIFVGPLTSKKSTPLTWRS